MYCMYVCPSHSGSPLPYSCTFIKKLHRPWDPLFPLPRESQWSWSRETSREQWNWLALRIWLLAWLTPHSMSCSRSTPPNVSIPPLPQGMHAPSPCISFCVCRSACQLYRVCCVSFSIFVNSILKVLLWSIYETKTIRYTCTCTYVCYSFITAADHMWPSPGKGTICRTNFFSRYLYVRVAKRPLYTVTRSVFT